MELLVDIGNSALKYVTAAGLFAGEPIQRHAFRETGLNAVLDRQWSGLPQPDSVTVASVAKTAGEQLGQWCEANWGLRPQFLASVEREAGVVNGYTTPSELGVDRWAALVGAHSMQPDNYCIVDAGTLITVDILAQSGQHQGGLILPGRQLLRGAMIGEAEGIEPAHASGTEFTAPAQHADWSEHFPGRDTRQCVEQGSRAAMVGMIHSAMERAAVLLGTRPRCLVCGGDASWLVEQLETPALLCEELVLRGVARLAGLVPA